MNYENPTVEDYLNLVNEEAFAVQLVERFEVLGFENARLDALEDKKRLRIARVCMKAALRMRKAASAGTPTALSLKAQ